MKILEISCELDYVATSDATYLFNIQAAVHPWQKIVHEKLTVEPASPITLGMHPSGLNRLAKVSGNSGPLRVRYDARVKVDYALPSGTEAELSASELPVDVIPYTWPSRYCESDAAWKLAERTFGNRPRGYQRVNAICEWIRENIAYEIGTSGPTTSARDILVNRAGVCRDFAHLGIIFCRALSIPARFVTGYTWFADPPPDFHAMFEAYLGNRWILFDPTNMCQLTDFARIATGYDASDTAFSTIYGSVNMTRMSPEVVVSDERAPTFIKSLMEPLAKAVA